MTNTTIYMVVKQLPSTPLKRGESKSSIKNVGVDALIGPFGERALHIFPESRNLTLPPVYRKITHSASQNHSSTLNCEPLNCEPLNGEPMSLQ